LFYAARQGNEAAFRYLLFEHDKGDFAVPPAGKANSWTQYESYGEYGFGMYEDSDFTLGVYDAIHT